MSWQLKICFILLILGLFASCFVFVWAQEPQNSDFRPSETKVVVNYSGGLKNLQKAILGFWQTILDKTRPFLAYIGEIMEKRKDILKEEFKKEIEEMRGDFTKLFKFLWDKATTKQ